MKKKIFVGNSMFAFKGENYPIYNGEGVNFSINFLLNRIYLRSYQYSLENETLCIYFHLIDLRSVFTKPRNCKKLLIELKHPGKFVLFCFRNEIESQQINCSTPSCNFFQYHIIFIEFEIFIVNPFLS